MSLSAAVTLPRYQFLKPLADPIFAYRNGAALQEADGTTWRNVPRTEPEKNCIQGESGERTEPLAFLVVVVSSGCSGTPAGRKPLI